MFNTLTAKLDSIYYHIHRIFPTSIAYHTLNWTKYTSSKFTTAIGGLGVALYNASILGDIAQSEGIEGIVNNAFDSPERILTLASVLAIDIGYTIFFAKNWKRANVEKERASVLNDQSLSHVIPHEEKLQRVNYSSTAIWYTTTEAAWPIFMEMTGSLSEPVGQIGLAGIMLATSALYGARYALYTEFSSKKEKELGLLPIKAIESKTKAG